MEIDKHFLIRYRAIILNDNNLLVVKHKNDDDIFHKRIHNRKTSLAFLREVH